MTLFILFLIQLLFSLYYIVSKEIVAVLDPIVWAFFRCIVGAGILFLLAFVLKRKALPLVWKGVLLPIALLSLLGTVANQTGLLIGLKYTSAANTSVLITLLPIFTLAIELFRGQESFSLKRAIGFALAFLGVLVLRGTQGFSITEESALGDLFVIGASFLVALFLSLSAPYSKRFDPIWLTAWLFLFGGVVLFFLAAPTLLTMNWPSFEPRFVGNLVYALLGGTVATYFLTIWVMRRVSPSTISLWIYVQPLLTFLLSVLVYEEVLTWNKGVATGLVLMGFLIGRDGKKKS